MKPQRPTTAIVLLFVAVLAVWLTLRPHPAPPPTTEDTPARREDAATPPTLPTPPMPGPVPSAPERAPTTEAPAPAPTVAASPVPTAAMASPHAEPPTTAASNAASPAAPRGEAASVNAIRVRRMVTDYHTLTGENPVGTNAEIMAAVMGKNPRQAVLGPPDGIELNRQGELIDEWGTPYFFHQLSRDLMEIHSAGPDKILGTADDIVVR